MACSGTALLQTLYIFIYLLIYIFNDDVSTSDYTVSTDGMINEHWNGKEMESSGRGHI
jgi:hypothetical protein